MLTTATTEKLTQHKITTTVTYKDAGNTDSETVQHCT